MTSVLFPFLSTLLLCSLGVFGNSFLKISNASDFYAFANDVNNGTSFLGTTVFLDSDLSLPELTEPVGFDSKSSFAGVFDGQGYSISDFRVKTLSRYAGLFGYGPGIVIKNVVLDSSCSVTSSYGGSSEASAGGIVGHCYASNDHCILGNSVNMASVTVDNYTGYGFNLGGAVGNFAGSSSHGAYVRSCANYGSVTDVSNNTDLYIGGVVGHIAGLSDRFCLVQNSLNYGTITRRGATGGKPVIGGVVGYIVRTHIELCMSSGKIVPSNESATVGGVAGRVGVNIFASHCYFTADVGDYKVAGRGYTENVSHTPHTPTDAPTIVAALNEQAEEKVWNKWVLNTNNSTVTFRVNNSRSDGKEKSLSLSSHVILLPNLAGGDRGFVGWFTDSSLKAPFSSPTVTGDTTLYGRWDEYMVGFDVNGGSGSFAQKEVVYGGPYGELPTPNRSGYTFVGWVNERNESVTSATVVETARDHTLYARWEEIPSEYVEVTFWKNGLGNKDIERAVRKHTKEDFRVKRVTEEKDEGKASGTKAVVKFGDVQDAKLFVEDVRASSSDEDIKVVRFILDYEESLSLMVSPVLLSIVFCLIHV